jgi:UDP-GlcNAc:undecaprenyl-phosphate/decaprenyl-phosphate GlcNAc-1-phosphate transferase
MLYLFVFFSSLIITIFSTPFLINFLTHWNIVDTPGGRRINTSAIPRMGGILIYIIVLAALLTYVNEYPIFYFVIVSSGLLALCGVLDDLKNLKWYIKYILHSLSAIVIIAHFYPLIRQMEIFGTQLPFPLDIIILFFFITGSVNALNMLDGMDGLVSGFSLLLFMLIFILAFSLANPFLLILSAASIGSLIGFLKYNANPAKIFLGDTGSLILGFFLVISALLLTHNLNPNSMDLGFPIILLGVPLIDTLRVILVRIWHGKSPFEADQNHIHHMISGNNIRHKTTVFIIQTFTVFFIMLSLVYLFYNQFIAYTLFCLSGVFLFLINYIMHLFRKTERIKNFIYKIIPDEIVTIDLYKRYLLPFSAVTVAGLLFLLFPSNTELPVDVTILMFLICGLLFTASFISQKRYHTHNDLYVLFNLLLFFSITNISHPWDYSSLFGDSRILLYFSFSSVAGIIALFFLTRKRLFQKENSLVSGIDMIMLSAIIFLLVVQNFINISGIDFIGGNLLLGFSIYIWYKIFMFFMPGLIKPVYYLTFALPFVTLIILTF